MPEIPQEWLRALGDVERMAARKRTGSENGTAGRSETATEDSMRSKKSVLDHLNTNICVASL